MRELNAYVDRKLVGTLREDNNLWVFEYDRAWIEREDSFDLSPALPRAAGSHRDGASKRPVQWYFDNLLPEEELRRAVAADAGIRDLDDAFALLQYLGAESAGSLTLLAPGVPLPVEQALQALSPDVLSDRIRRLPRATLSRGAPKRMSLAGAQHKLLAVLKGGDLYEPVGATPSTHILKPDHPDAQTYPASTFLEYLTMTMAAAAGLAVPKVSMLYVPEPVYVIERFDRRTSAQEMQAATGSDAPHVERLHIIDACQLLNKSKIFKYEGATIEALRKVIEASGDVLTLPPRLFRWLVFNLLVGNDDCHLKNLSFMVQANTVALAPHYDMLATSAYHTNAFAGEAGHWPAVRMAIPLPGPASTFAAVTPQAVMEAAASLGVPQRVAQRVVREVVAGSCVAFDRFFAAYCPDEPIFGAHAVALVPPLPPMDDAGLGLHRRMLRVLRYIILPEMAARIMSPP
jgi:serine/threonine-protein kinase HipA